MMHLKIELVLLCMFPYKSYRVYFPPKVVWASLYRSSSSVWQSAVESVSQEMRVKSVGQTPLALLSALLFIGEHEQQNYVTRQSDKKMQK